MLPLLLLLLVSSFGVVVVVVVAVVCLFVSLLACPFAHVFVVLFHCG